MHNKAEELLLRMRSDALERAHSALIVPLLGHSLAVLLLLCVFLRIVPIDIVAALSIALIGPVALMLWAMWRTQAIITDVTARLWVAYGVEGRVVEFQYVDWRIVGSE